MEENRKCKKTFIIFGSIKKGMYIEILQNGQRLSYLLPVSWGSNVMTFAQSWAS